MEIPLTIHLFYLFWIWHKEKKRLVSENQFNYNFLDKSGNFHGKSNACHCYSFLGQAITIIIILTNQNKILENSRTTYSAQKSCMLFQNVLKTADRLVFTFTLFTTIELGFSMSHNKKDYLLLLSISRELS